MNSISIDNVKYVKATDIARELGYTADYVGQLCRAHKVDAQLVGRSWYVSEDSLRGHKKTRYRSTKSANKKTISTSIEAKDLDAKESFGVPVSTEGTSAVSSYAKESFYRRTPTKAALNYSADQSELLPTSSKVKTGRLSVSLGDSQTVKIKSHSKEFDFNPTVREEVRFSGSLSVKDVYDEEEKALEEPLVSVEPTKKVARKKAEANRKQYFAETANKIKVRHLRKDRKLPEKNLPIENNPVGVLGMRRDRITDRNPVGGTLKISVPSANETISAVGVYYIVVSTVISVALSFFVVGLQSDISVEGTTLITSYTFELKELLAAVYSAW